MSVNVDLQIDNELNANELRDNFVHIEYPELNSISNEDEFKSAESSICENCESGNQNDCEVLNNDQISESSA